MTRAQRVARYLRAIFGREPPMQYERGFADGLAWAELVAGWDLTRTLPQHLPKEHR